MTDCEWQARILIGPYISMELSMISTDIRTQQMCGGRKSDVLIKALNGITTAFWKPYYIPVDRESPLRHHSRHAKPLPGSEILDHRSRTIIITNFLHCLKCDNIGTGCLRVSEIPVYLSTVKQQHLSLVPSTG